MDKHFLQLSFVLCIVVHLARSECEFAAGLQNTEAQDDHWNFRTNRYRGANTVVRFNATHIHALRYEFDKPGDESSEICAKYFPESDRYLVKGENQAGNVSYVCVHIEQRTPNVYSYKRSDSERSSDTNCTNDILQGYHWLLVANIPRDTDPSPLTLCPITGSFQFRAAHFDEKGQEEILCSDHPSPSILDAQCMPGDGITIAFPHRICVPPETGWDADSEHISVRLKCLEHWMDEEYHYGILGDEYYVPKWSVRIPLNMTAEIRMELHMEIIMPLANETHSTPFTYFNLTQLGPHSECSDDLADCDLNYCDTKIYDRVCRQSCDICENTTALTSCDFGRPFRGTWTQHTDRYTSDVTIDVDNLNIQYFGQFTCEEKHDDNLYVARSDFDNGCVSQKSCVSLEAETTPVMKYKIGQAAVAGEPVSADYLCDPERFRDDPDPLRDTYRSQYSKVLIDDIKVNSFGSSCNLGGVYTLDQVHYGSETTCGGNLTDVTDRDYGLDLVVKCASDYTILNFRCVHHLYLNTTVARALLTQNTTDQLGDINNNTTKYSDDDNGLNCWLFHSDDNLTKTFYVLKSPQCNENTYNEIQSGTREPAISGIAYFFSTGIPETHTTPTEDFVTSEYITSEPSTPSPPGSNSTGNVDKKRSSGLSPGHIAGIVFGSLLGGALLACVVFLAWRFYTSQRQPYRIL